MLPNACPEPPSKAALLAGGAQQALQTPQAMLEEVLWCVSQPLESARLDPQLHPLTTHPERP